jgi:integral membrane sensor domain MASE1
MNLRLRLARPSVRWTLQVAAVAAAYVATGKFGLELAFESDSVTAIWAPSGISLAALVLWGPRVWPGVALGAFLTNLGTGVPLYAVAGITVGNTLEAVVGAWLLRTLADFRPDFDRVRDVFSFVVFGALLSTMISATIGIASLRLAGEVGSDELLSTWRTWWLGDMGGDLIVAPAILVAATWLRPPRPLPGGALEAALLAASVAGLGVFIFTQDESVTYLTFPVLVWAALRFWQPGAVTAELALAAIAVYLTEHGHGPFADQSPDDRLLLAETFVGVTGLLTLILATVTHARDRADRAARSLAETLQDSLLAPDLPELPRLESAAYFRAAGEGQRVGGDFYDLFQGGDGSWVLAVGDVCGKGADAAAMTALVRYTLRAGAATEPNPTKVLAQLNEAILWQRRSEEYCTVAYVRIDFEDRTTRLTFASGGHPLPLILRANGSVETLGRPGMLLGVEARPRLSEAQAELQPSDTLVVYTDGLTDAFAPDEILTVHQLSRQLADLAGLPPAELLAKLRYRLLAREHRQPRDDVAIVAIRMVGTGEPAPLERLRATPIAPPQATR